MTTLRTPIALAIALLMLLVAVANDLSTRRAGGIPGRPAGPTGAIDIEALRSEWVRSVEEVLEGYEEDADAAKARDALLALRVPADAKDAHLALVLAFQEAADHPTGGRATLEQARSSFEAYKQAVHP